MIADLGSLRPKAIATYALWSAVLTAQLLPCPRQQTPILRKNGFLQFL